MKKVILIVIGVVILIAAFLYFLPILKPDIVPRDGETSQSADEKEEPENQSVEKQEEVPPANESGCVAKWYTAGQQITGLKGKDGKLYNLVIGDITSSGIGEHEISLNLYEKESDFIVDSGSFSAGEKTDFRKPQNEILIKEVRKFETGAEPFKTLIEICR